MSHFHRVLVASLLSSVFVACGDDGPSGEGGSGGDPGGGGGSGGAGGEGESIVWQPCDVLEEYPPLEETLARPGECATVRVPMDWEVLDGPTLEVFVKRVRSTTEPPTRRAWLLNGGPGAASEELDPLLLHWADAVPGLEVYTTDFRGAGRSTPLPCSNSMLTPSLASNCAENVEQEIGDLDAFTTTAAAHDVLHLVNLAGTELPVTLFGLSFGTFWAHRVLQLEPGLFAGAVFDSIAPPEADFSVYSPGAAEVAEDFFGRCAMDSTCSSKLGPDPWAEVTAFFALTPSEACPGAGLSQAEWNDLFARAIRKVETRPLVPALLYRMRRCSPEDEAAVGNLLAFLGSLPVEPDSAFHEPLYVHIALSELWDTTPLLADEYAAIDEQLLIAPKSTAFFQELWDAWPRTPEDPLAIGIAQATTPILMLQGGLDPQTPKKRTDPFAAALVEQGHVYAVFPDAPHVVISQTPVLGGAEQCGDLLVRGFLADPTLTSHPCQQEQPPLDFGDHPELAAEVFGTGSIWENVPVSPEPVPPPRSRGVRRAFLEMSRGR
jgi:pimeloyl-ACP methyl ester carboxylesterase